MGRALVMAWVVLAGCEKTKPAPATEAKTASVSPRGTFPSYEAWCSGLGKGTCTGEWEGHTPGVSELGTYRFVVVEYLNHRDGEGKTRDVYLELKHAAGVSYFALGTARLGKIVTSLMVKELVDRPGALEVRTVSRTSPKFTYSDYYAVSFIVPGAKGFGVIEFPVGKIIGNNEGETKGTVGTAEWHSGKITLKGTGVGDGEWTLSP